MATRVARVAFVAAALALVQCTTPGEPQPTLVVSSGAVTFSATAGGADPRTATVAIANGGGGSLSGITANVSYPAGQSAGWLTVSLSGTTAPATLTVSAVVGALAPRAHTATITLNAARLGNGPITVPVTFTVAAGGVTTLSATSLDWSAIAGDQQAPQAVVDITNGAAETLAELSVAVTYPGAAPSATPWLTATLNRTTAPAQLTLAALTGIAPGVHIAHVTLASPYAANGPQTITVSYTLLAAFQDLELRVATPLTVTPATIEAGQSISVSPWSLGNEGTLPTAPFAAGFYLSADNVFDAGDRELRVFDVSAGLLPGSWVDYGSIAAAIPLNAAGGQHYLLIVADPSGVIDESDETNNALSVPLAVTAAPAIGLDPDTLSWDIVFGASAAPRTVAVTNAGGGTLSQIHFAGISYGAGETQFGWLQPSLDRNTAPATLTVTLAPQSLTPGIHRAWVKVGAAGAVNDPDSVLVRIQVRPELNQALDSVHFEGAVAGPDPSPYNLFVGTTDGGPLGDLQAAVRYAPGEPTGWLTAALARDTAPTLLELRLSAAALPAAGGLFKATVEVGTPLAANGPLSWVVTFNVTGAADLVVTEPATLTVTPTPLQSGRMLTVPAWTITNQGAGSAGAFDYGVYLSTDPVFTADDVELLRETASGLGPSQTRNSGQRFVRVPSTTPPGNYWVGVVADVGQQVTETNESNNAKAAEVELTPAAVMELSADSLLFRFTVGAPLTSQRIVTITNSGGGTLDGLTWFTTHAPGQPEWVAALLLGNTAPAELQVALHSMTAEQLDPGTYTAEITVSSFTLEISRTIALTLIVDPALAVAPPLVTFTATEAGAAPTPQTVAVTSVRGTLSDLDVEITYPVGAAEGWLSTALSASTTPANLELSVDPTGLPIGTHTAQIAVTAPAAVNSPRIVSVELAVLAQAALQVAPTQLTFQGVAGAANPAAQTLTVTGTGGVVTGLTASAAYTTGQPNSWLQLTPSATSSPAEISVQAQVGGLTPGSYSATITVAGVASNSPRIVNVTFNVASPLPDLLVAGTGGPLTVTPASTPQATQVALSAFTITNQGSMPSGDYEIGIYLSVDGQVTTADVALLVTALPGLDAGASVNIPAGVLLQIPASVAAGSYVVGILLDGSGAIAEGDESNNSATAALTITPAPPPPAAPSGLVATVRSSSRIDLSWTDNSTTETRFDIERCAGTLSCSAIGGGPTFTVIASVGPNETSFQNVGLSSTSSYLYRVRAVNAAGSSNPSNTVSAIPTTPAPSNPVATATSVSQVTVTWTDNSIDETSFEVQRCAGASCTDFALVGTVGPSIATFADAGLGEASPYRYRVRAMASVASQFSPIAAVTTLSATTTPAAPSGLAATVVSGNQIDLTWVDNANNESGYRIERCQNVGCTSWVEIAATSGSSTSFQSTGLTGNTSYRFRVRAYNSVGNSAYAGPVLATTLPVPTAPSGFTVTVVNSGQIRLNWTDNSTNETGFRIERCQGTGCTTYTLLATTAANAVLYTDNSVSRNTTYRYRLAAVNANGSSAFLTGEGTTPPLETPTGLVATANSSGRITLTWTNLAPQITTSEVEIQRCSGVGCTSFTLIGDVGPNVATFVNTGLTPLTSYTYRVRARAAASQSDWSTAATAVTLAAPVAPMTLTATGATTNSISMTWVDNSVSGTQLEIERCAGSSACTNFTRIITVTAATEAYTNTGLQPATTYRYRVRTTDGDTPSAYSNIATRTTLAVAGTPAAPTNLVATVVSSGQINLTWNNPATNETGYIVERCTGSGCTNFATLVNQATANVTSYQNTGLVAQTTYSYRVRSFNASGNSLFSNIVTATTAALAAPTGLTGTVISATQINLSWTDNAVNETQFRIERCVGAGCTSFVQIGTTSANIVSFGNTGLSPATTYTYRVRAADNVPTFSAYSSTVTLTTQP